jgi:hypothetical protein
MPASKVQILALRDLLDMFSLSTGLNINYNKSQMVPINVPDDLILQLAADFGCQIVGMSFTYIVLPNNQTSYNGSGAIGVSAGKPFSIEFQFSLSGCSATTNQLGTGIFVPTFFELVAITS